jgi:hypothetical protein
VSPASFSGRRARAIPSLLLLFSSLGVWFPAPSAAAPSKAADREDEADRTVFVPDAEAEGAPPIDGTTWLSVGGMHSMRLTRLGQAARQAYLRKVIGLPIDPFAVPPDAGDGYPSFLLQVQNHGDSAILFNPLHCWLMTNKKEIQTPVGLSDLSFLLKVVDFEMPAAYEKVGPALLDEPRTIYPGETIHGLLIYKPFKKKTKRFSVDVQLTLPTGDLVRLSAPYRRQTDEEARLAAEENAAATEETP